jgi:hypothetical protein
LGNKTCGSTGTQFKDEDVCEISKEATPDDKKEEPILKKLEEVHIKTRTTPSIEFAKGVRAYGLGSNRLWRSIRQVKTVP